MDEEIDVSVEQLRAAVTNQSKQVLALLKLFMWEATCFGLNFIYIAVCELASQAEVISTFVFVTCFVFIYLFILQSLSHDRFNPQS
jgi:hypothetical protein